MRFYAEELKVKNNSTPLNNLLINVEYMFQLVTLYALFMKCSGTSQLREVQFVTTSRNSSDSKDCIARIVLDLVKA